MDFSLRVLLPLSILTNVSKCCQTLGNTVSIHYSINVSLQWLVRLPCRFQAHLYPIVGNMATKQPGLDTLRGPPRGVQPWLLAHNGTQWDNGYWTSDTGAA
jgi:hypothetical protein